MDRRHFLSLPFLAVMPCQAQSAKRTLAILRQLLESPVAYAKAKLTIDGLSDPKADAKWAASEIERLIQATFELTHKALRAGGRALEAKLTGIRTCLYEAGPWNDWRPFQYDLSTALVRGPVPAQSLIWYLRHHRGNCVSMPALFMALGERLGLDAAFSLAPLHLLVKIRDPAGRWHNLECTDKARPRPDETYIRELEITPQALASGLYLRPLSRTQALLTLMESVDFNFWDHRDVDAVHAIADLFMEFEPNGFQAVRMRKRAFELQLNRDYTDHYPRWEDVPRAKVAGALRIIDAIREMEKKAEAMGWRHPSPAVEAAYRRSIGRAMSATPR